MPDEEATALTAEEEALLAEALPSAPEEFSAGAESSDGLSMRDLAALEQEDAEIRRRTAAAMASLSSDLPELREMLMTTPRGGRWQLPEIS